MQAFNPILAESPKVASKGLSPKGHSFGVLLKCLQKCRTLEGLELYNSLNQTFAQVEYRFE